ncbi:MAG TPA: carboxypeptidase-like regulatory domain-containing protein [Bryobacteraceae bacterium]|nr:carboxypeptidase-like regulatory domain-containing protein [Bryobacteraceae bacterium]
MKEFAPRRVILAITNLLALGSLVPLARGQAVANAQLNGQVVDPSGSVVARAALKMIQTDTSATYSATRSADGRYTFPTLPIGPHRLAPSLRLAVVHPIRTNENFWSS